MRPLISRHTWILARIISCIFLLRPVTAYFQILQPTSSTTWEIGQSNGVSWTKGVLDEVDSFDVELARLSVDGLIFVAADVPARSNSVNILIQDVLPANDYYLMFLNSTLGTMCAVSEPFTISNATNTTSNTSVSSPNPTASVVTVTGGPDPTSNFAATLLPRPNDASGLLGWTGTPAENGWPSNILYITGVLCGGLAGVAFAAL